MRMIAKSADVSPTTVSHVLNETQGTFIAQDTRKRVLDTAAKLGYQTSLLSRSIKKSLHHLGIATTRRNILALDATAVVFDAFRQEAISRGYLTVDLPISDGVGEVNSAGMLTKMKSLYDARLVDGFLIDKQNFNNDVIIKLKRAGVPMVLVNGEPYFGDKKSVIVPSVIVDTYIDSFTAVEYLAGLGHKNIAMMTRPHDRIEKIYRPFQVSRLRKGFYAAMKQHRLSCKTTDAVDGEPESRKLTQQALAKLMSRKNRPTAIIVGDDAIAIVVIEHLLHMGLRVPQDVSVLACGGWDSVTRLSPIEMTVLHSRFVDNGKLAAKMLIDMFEGEKVPCEVTALPSKLIVGKTTGPAKKV